MDFRPVPFWSWNDKMEKSELKHQMIEMKKAGYGGFFMHSRLGLITGYLSNEWFDIVRYCAEEGYKMGLDAWIYDEDKWPSGFGGGIVSKNPHYRARCLVIVKKGEKKKNDIPLAEMEDDLFTYQACVRVSETGDAWFNGMCYADLLNKEAVRCFLNCTHEVYKEKCSDLFGKEIKGVFTDEPCCLWYKQTDPCVPWTDKLPQMFKEKYGYDLVENIESIFFERQNSSKVRFDFFDCVTNLYIESFCKPYYEWCNENNLKLTGHFMAEDFMTAQIKWSGAVMPLYQYMDIPGCDKLGKHIKRPLIMLQTASACAQLGRRALCETYACMGQSATIQERKWIADWLLALGINFINNHLFQYSMKGDRKRDCPPDLSFRQPWWEGEADFSAYLERTSELLFKGKSKNVLVIHPISSAWCEYSPIHAFYGEKCEADELDDKLLLLIYKLLENRISFHFGDEMMIKNIGNVQGDKFIIGEENYDTVLISGVSNIRKNTFLLLKEFASNGGRIIVDEKYPERCDGLYEDLSCINAVICESTDKAIDKLSDYCISKVINLDTKENAGSIYARKADNILFYVNTDEKQSINTQIELQGLYHVKEIDAFTGESKNIKYEFLNDNTYIYFNFAKAGSLILKIEKTKDNVCKYEFEHSIADDRREIKNYKCGLLNNNIFVIGNVSLWLNEKLIHEDAVIEKALKDFFEAPDGTSFKASYKFRSEVNLSEAYVIIEQAVNLEKITFNGINLEVSPQLIDNAFYRLVLPEVKRGENEIVIEGKKVNNIVYMGNHRPVKDFEAYNTTELEQVYICGDFSVSFKKGEYVIDEPKQLNLQNIRKNYPFYTGKVSVRFNLDKTDKEAVLKFENINCAMLGAKVNGEQIKNVVCAPWEINLTGLLCRGVNEVELILATTLFGVMGCARSNGIKENTYINTRTFYDTDNYNAEYAVEELGIDKIYLCTKK